MNIKTVILKLSGESLGDIQDGIILNGEKLSKIIDVIKELRKRDIRVGIVTGAGNIFRGRISQKIGVDTETGDYMGMIGTIVNCLSICSLLNQNGVNAKVISALEITNLVPKYSAELAKNLLNEGNVVLFAGGIGLPNYTTDTCAASRAIDINADMILSGKNGVDGVYDDDPNKNKNAHFIHEMSYYDIINKNLKVMDQTAANLLKDSKIITKVFSMDDIDNFIKIVDGEDIGTTIKGAN